MIGLAEHEISYGPPPPGPLHVVGFAGGGGSSKAYQLAGHRVSVALNHDAPAVAMHRMNHPEAHHYLEDIRLVDPVKVCAGRQPDSAWFSPDCRDFSKAKGGKPKSKRVRGLAWVVINWANKVRPKVIFLENVEEFREWCPLTKKGTRKKRLKGWFFQCFVGALRRRGYQVDWQEQRACDYDAATIRKRLFMVARCDGLPIVWHDQTRAAPDTPRVLAGELEPHAEAAGCIDFTLPCPSIFMTRRQAKAYTKRTGIKLQRPLAKASHKRFADGTGRYAMNGDPYLVCLTHQGNDGVEDIRKPMKTITGAYRGERALAAIAIAQMGYGERKGQRPRSMNPKAPLGTVVSGGVKHAVVAAVLAHAQNKGSVRSPRKPLLTVAASNKDQNQLLAVHLAQANFGEQPSYDVRRPARTIVAGGGHESLISCFLAQNNGGMVGHDAAEPMSTIAGKGSNQSLVACWLAKYYGVDQDPRLKEALHSVTTKDRFGLLQAQLEIPVLTPELAKKARRVARWLRRHGVKVEGEFAMCGEFVIVDIGMRMLTPRELYRAQGFPDSYIIDRGIWQTKAGAWVEIPLTKTQQVRMVGNSVSPLHGEKIIAANLGRGNLFKAAA